ncbi:MAG: hypothetical protein B7Z66_01730 [Chromatiales bacterium 21-64-14]|nr:MAG: hypothetical protein B7Z66_01730 [Chromatiales bacterium 21-64-14]
MQQGEAGRLQVVGDLSFQTVPQVWADSEAVFQKVPQLEIDLRDVSRSDSAGLALLVEWMRQARRAGKVIRFYNIPRQMLAIARVSSLDQILPLARD